jgi:glutamate dehydrogenase
VRNNPDGIDIAITNRYYQPGARMVAEAMPGVLDGADREVFDERVHKLGEAGVPAELARRAAAMPSLLSVFDIVGVESATKRQLEQVMEVYFGLGSRLQLNWLRDRIIELPRTNRWQALSRAALRDDLYSLHRALTKEVLETGGRGASAEESIETWSERNSARVERAQSMLGDIKASRSYDTTTLPVALREVRNLIRGTVEGGGRGAEAGTMAG